MHKLRALLAAHLVRACLGLEVAGALHQRELRLRRVAQAGQRDGPEEEEVGTQAQHLVMRNATLSLLGRLDELKALRALPQLHDERESACARHGARSIVSGHAAPPALTFHLEAFRELDPSSGCIGSLLSAAAATAEEGEPRHVESHPLTILAGACTVKRKCC